MEETEATAVTPAVAMVDTGVNIPQCCCGRPEEDCSFLARNNATLAGLERDVQTAARMGQVSAFSEYLFISMACSHLSSIICLQS